mgnify:CR=1 FL=1|tara:strand:- start:24294 stop:25457 length:1164 start_codon:yes stop_codon:yes gene_type:complete
MQFKRTLKKFAFLNNIMSKNKILFIAPRFHTNQFFLTKQLIEHNIEVNFLAVYTGGSENHSYVKPILLIPSIITKWFLRGKDQKEAEDREALRKYHISSYQQCRDVYKKLNPDILVIRNLKFFISIQHLILGLIFRKKIFLYTQNRYHEKVSSKRKFFYRVLKKIGIKHFTPVLGDVDQPIIPNTFYIPFVIDKLVEDQSISAKSQVNGIQLITIGKMNDRKNIKELVDSLFRVNFFDNINNTLIIVSECITEQNYTYLNSIKERIHKNKEQIEFHLNISHSMVLDLLKSSDLFILPSHGEPAAFSVLEAMACGLAVVCSDKNGTKCYIENNVNGFVFKHSKDFQDLDVVLETILTKETLRKYGWESLRLIEKNHGLEKFYRNVILN